MPFSIWNSAQRHWSLSNMRWEKMEVRKHTVVNDYWDFPACRLLGLKNKSRVTCPHLTKVGPFSSCMCRSSVDQRKNPKQIGSSAQYIVSSSLHRDASLGTQRAVWRKPGERLKHGSPQGLKWNLLKALSWVYFIKVDTNTNSGLKLGILLPLLQYSGITLCIRIPN